jgi:hypothetical protein
VALFVSCWTATLLGQLGLLPLAGAADPTLYGLYSLAAALGWFFGNVYVARRRRTPRDLHTRLRWLYLAGPPSVVYLVRTMEPAEQQHMAPLVPVFGFGVYGVLFAVPVVLSRIMASPYE